MTNCIIIKTTPGLVSDLREVSYETITLKPGFIKFSKIYEVNPHTDIETLDGYHNNYEWIYESNNRKSLKLFDTIATTLKQEINNNEISEIYDAGSFEIMMFDNDKKEVVQSFPYNFKWNHLNESAKLIKKLFPSAEELPRILAK